MSDPDYFTEIAAELFGVGYMDVDKKMRRRVKSIILQVSYGKYDRPINPFDPDYQVVGTITGRMQPKNPPLRSLNPYIRGY